MCLQHLFSRIPDDCYSRLVRGINGIQALLLLSRISAIIISRLPIYVGCRLLGKSAPAPEIQSRKQATFFRRLYDSLQHMLIVCISAGCRSSFCKLEAITRETELLKHYRLAVSCRNFQMSIDICISIGYSLIEICCKCLFANPAPVVRPDMNIHIIDIRA